jgi:hypothetical protein
MKTYCFNLIESLSPKMVIGLGAIVTSGSAANIRSNY